MELFFTEPGRISSNQAHFDPFESKHIVKTMRKRIGDEIHFTDGQGTLYLGSIIETKPYLILKHKVIKVHQKPEPQLALGIGFIKHSRMDIIIEKSTELGINEFYLIATQNANYYTDNVTRWQKIARQAVKQSLRFFLPRIACYRNFSEFISDLDPATQKFIADQNAASGSLSEFKAVKNNTGGKVLFVIGPEGGFNNEEIELAKKTGFYPVSFGKFRFRTETAAIAAAAYLNLVTN